MFQHSRRMHGIWALVLGMMPACNVVLGNEQGLLEDSDGWTLDPAADLDAATTERRSDAAATDPEASSMDPGTSIEAGTTDASGEATIDPSQTDSDHSDSVRSLDGSDRDQARCDTGVSVCAAGQIASEMQTCGPCAQGVQTRTRTCAPGGCAWGPWSAWSACSVPTAACMPGQSASETQACGPCNTGTQSRTRSCTASCTWGAWSAFNACSGITAECLPDHWRCCGSGMWEWCYVNSCTWTGGCAACNGSCNC